jgi:MFS family permease
MSPRKAQVAWEERWSRPTALAALAAVGFVVAAIVVATQSVGGTSGDSELLRHVDQHRSAQLISSILQAIGVGLIAAPLYYLFRAAKARSDRMRGQLVGVVVVAPLFLAVLAILSGISTMHAASDFVSNEVPRLVAKGVKLNSDRANEIASDAISEAPLRPLAAGFGLGGQLGFVVAMAYTCLYAMRVGLLPRFWGSLGIALGAVSFIFFQFALLWFVYLGLLLIGRVPGGKPPAWESGEAIPWPSPGEKAAADLSPPSKGDLPPPAEEEEATPEKGQSQ